MKSYKHLQQKQYDYAQISEDLFCDITGAVKGSKEDDFNHIDCYLDGKTYDVKGNKGCHKKGYVLVELKNVQGKSGWCSKDGADKVAFQFYDCFVVIDNMTLYKFARQKAIQTHNPKRPVWRENAVHKKYGYTSVLYRCLGRKGREDVFMYITKDDLMSLKEKIYNIK